MLHSLAAAAPDPLLTLIDDYRKDPRDSKIDLGVGVYRDEKGRTPVMAAVKAAETILWKQQSTKSYLGAEGDCAFVEALTPLVFGKSSTLSGSRVSGLQSVGGTGALRLAAELLRLAGTTRIWIGQPTWLNHEAIFRTAGLELLYYRYLTRKPQGVCVSALFDALDEARAGDAVLLHGVCHNPSGADLDSETWQQISAIVAKKRLVPVIDIAYQGFAGDVAEDLAGARFLLAHAPQAIVTVSCAKTFGLYRERAGAIFTVTEDAKQLVAVRSNLVAVARAMYSMPPDHGAAVVRTILQDRELTALWKSELSAMRERIDGVRRGLGYAAARAGLNMHFIARQHGMFSLLDLTDVEIDSLRREHGIYIAPGGRINVAGLNDATIARFVGALDTLQKAA